MKTPVRSQTIEATPSLMEPASPRALRRPTLQEGS